MALLSCGVTGALVFLRRFLEEQGVFLSQVRDDERVTLSDVCATLRDYEGREKVPRGRKVGLMSPSGRRRL